MTDSATARCLRSDCEEPIVRIERYKVTVGWERGETGEWELGAFDTGTHFHVFCAAGHEARCWANPDPHADGGLPEPLLDVVYPGSAKDDATYRRVPPLDRPRP